MNGDSAALTNEEVKDLRDLHGDVRKLMGAIGDLSTQIEKDQAERRALNWAKRPVWLAALALAGLLGLELWKASGHG